MTAPDASTVHTEASDAMHDRARELQRKQNRLDYLELEAAAVEQMKAAMHARDLGKAVWLALEYGDHLAHLDRRLLSYLDPVPAFLTSAFDDAIDAITRGGSWGGDSGTAARWMPNVPADTAPFQIDGAQ